MLPTNNSITEIGMNINNHIGLMLRQDNNRAETAPPKSAKSGTAIASEGVALRGTPIINNALAKTANIYISICADLSFLLEACMASTKISSAFLFSCVVMRSPISNSLTEISNASHIGKNRDTSGIFFPVSHRDTDLFETPNFSANSICVKPFALRFSARKLPIFS